MVIGYIRVRSLVTSWMTKGDQSCDGPGWSYRRSHCCDFNIGMYLFCRWIRWWFGTFSNHMWWNIFNEGRKMYILQWKKNVARDLDEIVNLYTRVVFIRKIDLWKEGLNFFSNKLIAFCGIKEKGDIIIASCS